MAKVNLFDLGHTWSLKKGAKKIELDIFFRGIGGRQDCVLALAKLAKVNLLPVQAVMVDGIQFPESDDLCCCGEASLGLTYYSMDPDKDLAVIKSTLLDCRQDPDYEPGSWINDHDQYGKIQIRSQIADGGWSSWTAYDHDTQLEAA